MRTRSMPRLPRHQRGWLGMVVILIALLIVAWLSKDALMRYGMLGESTTATKRSAQGGGNAGAGEGQGTSPTNVREKAKALEGLLQQESTKRGGDN